MAYDSVFGASTIYPSQVTYLALALTQDTTLQWPLQAAPGGADSPVIARIMEITPSGAGLSLIMPDATETGPGQDILFFNAGASSFTVKSSTGSTLLTVAPGLSWALYLRDNTTPTGLWRTFQYGASTAQAQASALAGFGLVAQGPLLTQSQPVVTFAMNYTAGLPDRAAAYVWTGGLGTLGLTAASALGNNWFMSIRNAGAGNLTIAPAGADVINGAATIVLLPGDSATINCDGTSFYTVGLGQNPVFAFDYTSIDLTGLSGTYVLSGAQLNRIAYDFVGVLAGNIKIVVPATTQQYWVANDTTGGSYTLTVATAAQVAPVNVVRGGRGIYYCDGSNVKNADTASIATPIAIADGGTGATTASDARINLGGTAVGIGVFTAASAAVARASLSAAASGANVDITSLGGLVANITGTGDVVLATSPTLVTPALGVASATSVNLLTFTAPATGATLTLTDGKTLAVSNTLTFAGTDATTMTFPPASASVGYLEIPQNSKSADYTAVLADSGKHIFHPSTDANARTFTIPANGSVAYPVGTAITFVNMSANNLAIAITTDTLYLAGAGTTGSRTLAQYSMATALKMTATTWIISGSGLS